MNLRCRGVMLGCAIALLSGCSSASIGSDSYNTGRSQVVELANSTLSVVPVDSVFVPHRQLVVSDTDRELCHKKLAGFAYSKLAARQPEVTAYVELPPTSDAGTVLGHIESLWRSKKYGVDVRGLRDPDFPNVRATAGEYQLVATSFSNTAGFANKPRISIYAVGRCLNA